MSAHPSTAVRLAQRYTLCELIAVGGMGAVHLATDERLGRPVAVKVLGRAVADVPDSVERFRREALTAAGLVHPSIAQVYDYGVDGDAHFIVMEYVPGSDLAHVLRERGRLTPAEAVAVTTQVCAALSVAHAAGVVHRDIKPGNLILTDDGRVKVTDFGIARVRGQATITDVGEVLGTAAYLSPEQVRGETASPASDLYSLGILLYRMLTGAGPFDGDTPVAIALRHLDEPVPRPSASVADLPPALDAVVARATAKTPHDRFADAAAMARALHGRETAEIDATRPLMTLADVTAPLDLRLRSGGPTPPAPGHRRPRQRARRRALLWVGGSLAAALAVSLGAAIAVLPGARGAVTDGAAVSRSGGAPASSPAQGPAQDSTQGTTPSQTPTGTVTQPPTQTAAPIDPVDPTPIPDASSPGTVPTDLVGTSSADVERALGDLGLRVRRIAVRSSAPDGQVLATVPRAGAATAPGQSVLVVASAGRDHGRDGGDGWVVPRWLVGAKADRLSRGLRGRGITPVAVPVASDQPRGTVVATYPGPGAAVRSGQLVLATSTGKPAADRP